MINSYSGSIVVFLLNTNIDKNSLQIYKNLGFFYKENFYLDYSPKSCYQREVKMIMNIRQRLNKNYNELNGLYHDISMKLGLSDSESMVMYMLYDIQEPLTQSDIVKATGLSKQTLNSAIRKLEKEGIIILEKLNEKSKKIVMTDKGQVLIEQKMKPLVDMEDRVLASWTEEDRRKYLELIEKFKVQFEKEVKAYDKRK